MSVTDELLAHNAHYAATVEGPLPLPPSKHVAVVARMDARLNVYGALGLHEGEAHVIRNAGGVVTASSTTRLRDADVHRRRPPHRQREGGRHQARVGGRVLHRPRGGRAAVDRRIKASPFIPKTDAVRGFAFDVATGRLDEVT